MRRDPKIVLAPSEGMAKCSVCGYIHPHPMCNKEEFEEKERNPDYETLITSVRESLYDKKIPEEDRNILVKMIKTATMAWKVKRKKQTLHPQDKLKTN
jgi:hypothetical protein